MQKSFLKIISLNIEMEHHLDRIIPFFNAQQPDVILLQEVLAQNKEEIEQKTGMLGIYTAQNLFCSDKIQSPIGLFTLSKASIVNHYPIFYKGNNDPLLPMTRAEPEKMARAILVTEVVKDQQSYWFINTHFTWSPNAKPSAAQHVDLKALLQLLSNVPEFILCGDFNAPRGTAIFDALAARYKDNIPLDVTTTIDKNLHKGGDLAIVVDGIFTTPTYLLEDVHVNSDVSDHYAIVARVKKV